MHAITKLFLAGALSMAFGTGCALHRSVVTAEPQKVAESATGKAVVITRVTDLRTFEVSPGEPSTPSLMDGAITDKATTARAVGRKRGGFGKAFGDVLLPPGETVEGLVRETVANALREAGYRVVPEGETPPPDARDLEVGVNQLWTWFTPGFWFVTLNFRSVLELNGSAVKGGSATVRSELDKGFQVVVESDWAKMLTMGRDLTGRNIKEKLENPS